MAAVTQRAVRLAIAIPTYNEVDNLPVLVTRLKKVLSKVRPAIICTVLIIDDNSPDGTGAIADGLARAEKGKRFRVRVLHRPQKQGLGKAYVAGFTELLSQDFTHILQMDADLSHKPEYIPDLLAAAKTADLIIGSRYVPGGGVLNWGLHRRVLSHVANRYTRTMLGGTIHDYTGGFNLYTRELLSTIRPQSMTSGGYGFELELKYRVAGLGTRISEVPIVFVERATGKSKIPRSTILTTLLLVARLRLVKS